MQFASRFVFIRYSSYIFKLWWKLLYNVFYSFHYVSNGKKIRKFVKIWPHFPVQFFWDSLHFTHIAASNRVIDGVANLVAYRIFNTKWLCVVLFCTRIWEKILVSSTGFQCDLTKIRKWLTFWSHPVYQLLQFGHSTARRPRRRICVNRRNEFLSLATQAR